MNAQQRMREFMCVLIALSSCALHTNAQQAFPVNIPRVTVTIQLPATSFVSSDSVKFVMTITNPMDTTQRLLFNKPLERDFPWGTSTLVKNIRGQSMVKIPNRELISSHIYSEEELERKHCYDQLQPGQQLSHTYYLRDLPIFKTADGKLPAGKYTLQVVYYVYKSNQVSFYIR